VFKRAHGSPGRVSGGVKKQASIWRLTDFLLKASVDDAIDYAPVLTAGECVELISSALIPPD